MQTRQHGFAQIIGNGKTRMITFAKHHHWNQPSVHSCEMLEFQGKSFIKEISGSNRWLFRLFRNTTANIRCNEQHQVIRLPNQGNIQLLAGCTAILEDTTIITPQKVISTAYEMSIFPSLRIIDDKETWNVVSLKHLIVNNTNELQNLQMHIKILKNNEVHIDDLIFHTACGKPSALGLTTIIIIILVIYIRRQRINERRLLDVHFPPENV